MPSEIKNIMRDTKVREFKSLERSFTKMTKFAAVTKAGICPESRNFFRHGNIPYKSETNRENY